MPVTIIKVRTSGEPDEGKKTVVIPEAKAKPGSLEAMVSAVPERPKLDKAILLGKSKVLPDVNVKAEAGKQKFVVHLRKPVWYSVVLYDEELNVLKLRTQSGVAFESKLDRTMGRNYMVVVEPEGVKQPSAEAVAFVQKLLVQSGGES